MNKLSCYIPLLCLVLPAFTACKKMDDTYRKFAVPDGIFYSGKANQPQVHAGHNRAKITWLKNADPNVATAKVFWNNYTDSISVTIPPTGDTISCIISNLPEKIYSFIIKTYDAKGHSSVPVEVFGASYGDTYQSSLLSRIVLNTVLYPDSAVATWSSADISNGAYATQIKYTDTLGNNRVSSFPISSTTSTIRDLKPGTSYQYRTVFLPDSLSIDTFYTDYVTSKPFAIRPQNWKIAGSSSPLPGDQYTVTNMIDGNPRTLWVGQPAYPHWFSVDMGTPHQITSFTLYRAPGDDRGCDTFKLWTSSDNITWTDLGTFTFNRQTDEGQLFNIPLHPWVRYFKFTGLTGPQSYIVLGDISAEGF